MNSVWLLLSATTVIRGEAGAVADWASYGNPGDIVICIGPADFARLPMRDVAQLRKRRNQSFMTFLIAREEAPVSTKRIDQDVTSFACALGVLREAIQCTQVALPSAYDLAAYLMSGGSCDWIDCIQIPLTGIAAASEIPRQARPTSQEWIIPHRGTPGHLQTCLESVLRARHDTDIVSVVLDDESGQAPTTPSVEAPGLKYYRPDPCDIGPYIAREILSARSKCELLIFQDSDDLACSNRSAVLNTEIDHRSLDWLGSHELRFDEVEQKLLAVRMPIDVSTAMQRKPSSEYLLFPSTVIRNEALRRAGGFSTVRKFGGDGELLFRAAFSIRIGTQVLCIERVDGGVTTDPALLAKLQGWEF